MTLTNVDRLADGVNAEDAEAFQMDEDAFRAFYDRTARAVWAYLSRISGDNTLADDLLQETYYRFLCARVDFESEEHRRNYLFRIATNLVRDCRRRRLVEPAMVSIEVGPQLPSERFEVRDADDETRVRRALAQMKRRDREILWLAYAEGSSHREIAAALGLKAGSIKVMLHRARARLRRLLPSVAAHSKGER